MNETAYNANAVETHDRSVAERNRPLLAEADLLEEIRSGRIAELNGGWDEFWIDRIRDRTDRWLIARGDIS